MKFDWNQEITKRTQIPIAIKEDIHNEEYNSVYFFETEFDKDDEFISKIARDAMQKDICKIEKLIGADYQTNIILPNRQFKIKNDNKYHGLIVKVKCILTPKNKDKILANKRILIVYNWSTNIFIYQEKKIETDDIIKKEEDERDKNVKTFYMDNGIITIKDGIYFKGTPNMVNSTIKWTPLVW